MDKRTERVPLDSVGDFLSWWFNADFLQGKKEKVFKRYYSNYYKNFNGYLKSAWTERYWELDKVKCSSCRD